MHNPTILSITLEKIGKKKKITKDYLRNIDTFMYTEKV